MTRTARPRILSPCVADHYHGPTERIIEYSFPSGAGGLISFRTLDDGRDVIDIGATAAEILAPPSERHRAALRQIAALMSGQEWSPDTLDDIADILRGAGFEIADHNDGGGA